jgi:DNA repair exonuclease SbcCD ATPase subunit
MSVASEPIRALRRQLAAQRPDDLSKLDLLRFRAATIESLGIAEVQIDQLVSNFLENANMTTATLESPIDVDVALQQIDQESETAYRQLVSDLAAGRPVDANTIRPIVHAAGRTIDDLKRHRRMIYERREALADVERSATLSASLPDLKADSDAKSAAVRELYERQQAEMKPLVEAAGAARAAFSTARHESASLRRDAVATLSRTVSPTFRAEFGRSSNAVAAARREHERLVQAWPAREKRLTELETEIERLESLLAESDRTHGDSRLANIVASRRQWQNQIDAANAEIKQLRTFADTIEAAWKAHEDAKAALAGLEDTEFYDWRNVNFD